LAFAFSRKNSSDPRVEPSGPFARFHAIGGYSPARNTLPGTHSRLSFHLVKLLACLPLALLLALTGCRSFSARVEPGRDLSAYQRYFVKSNFNDNHSLDVFLVRALQARGHEADRGPETMMPHQTQAKVTYEDRWAWDFKDHMVALTITIYDARTERPVASADYVGPASMKPKATGAKPKAS
jgi:hypothetical protein